MTQREFLDIVFALVPKEANTIMDAFDEYVESAQLGTNLAEVGTDLISRQDAIDDIWTVSPLARLDRKWVDRWLRQLPSAQPEPKRGKWIEDKGQQILMKNFIERGEVWRVCSVCGAGHMIGYKYECDKAYHDTHHNFCPHCGADMRGEQDE